MVRPDFTTHPKLGRWPVRSAGGDNRHQRLVANEVAAYMGCGVGVFLGKNDNSTEIFLKHLYYVAELVGPEHVGLATDNMYDPASSSPTSRHPPHPGDVPWSDIKYVDPEQFPEITDGLLKHGYSDADIRGILGENWLRVARAVWK